MASGNNSFNPYNFNFLLLKISGFWQVWGKWRRVYLVYQACIICGYTLMLLSALFIVFESSQLFALNEIMVVSCGILIILIKSAFLIPCAGKVEQLQRDFNHHLYIPNINQEEDNRQEIQNVFHNGKKIAIFTSVAMIITAILWSVFPQVDKEIGLPIPFWWPSNQIKLQYFEIIYGYQVALLLTAALCLAGTDVSFCCFLLQISAHYKILINNINRMSSTKSNLNDFVTHHLAIKNAVKRMEEIFKRPVLVQITIGTFIVCVSGFEVFGLDSEYNGHIPSRLLYMVLALYDIFIYCLYADDIIQMSEKVAFATYNMPWQSSSFLRKDKHGIIMMIGQSRRPPCISIGSFAPLTLATYLTMLKMAYSIFSLLHQVVTK